MKKVTASNFFNTSPMFDSVELVRDGKTLKTIPAEIIEPRNVLQWGIDNGLVERPRNVPITAEEIEAHERTKHGKHPIPPKTGSAEWVARESFLQTLGRIELHLDNLTRIFPDESAVGIYAALIQHDVEKLKAAHNVDQYSRSLERGRG